MIKPTNGSIDSVESESTVAGVTIADKINLRNEMAITLSMFGMAFLENDIIKFKTAQNLMERCIETLESW
jgi:hypothetical protein